VLICEFFWPFWFSMVTIVVIWHQDFIARHEWFFMLILHIKSIFWFSFYNFPIKFDDSGYAAISVLCHMMVAGSTNIGVLMPSFLVQLLIWFIICLLSLGYWNKYVFALFFHNAVIYPFGIVVMPVCDPLSNFVTVEVSELKKTVNKRRVFLQ